MDRRAFIAGMTAAPLAAIPRRGESSSWAALRLAVDSNARSGQAQPAPAAKARAPIRQSVMASVWGTGSTLSFEERCRTLARIGFKGVDLPTADQVPILKKYGLAPAMMTGTGTSLPGRVDPQGAARRSSRPRFAPASTPAREAGCPEPDRHAGRATRHVARGNGRQHGRDLQPREGLCRAEERHALHGDHQLQGRRRSAHRPGVQPPRLGTGRLQAR